MCLIYRRKDGTAYVRLCYRTGRRGEHVELTSDEANKWQSGQHYGRTHATTPSYRRGRGPTMVIFDVGPALDVDIADMARYMGATRYTKDPTNNHVLFDVPTGVTPGAFRRAESFGWSHVA